MNNNCRKLGLDEETIKRCRDIGIEYLKKTYHMPTYASINYVIPAFIYIGANMYYEDRIRYIMCGNIKKKIGMSEIVTLYDVSVATGSKWLNNVISVLEIRKSNFITRP